MNIVAQTEPGTFRDFIRRDLAGRIRALGDPPAPLTLPSLSRHYGVSLTPVREAVRELLQEGLLIKGENGRLRVNPDRLQGIRFRTQYEPIAEPPRRADELEKTLSVEVISKSLTGQLDYLREEATARNHDVGRTAIRQVYGRLAGRGLLVHEPRKGWRVRAFDLAGLDSYLEVREVLELKALDLAWPRLIDADLRRMLQDNRPNDRPPKLDNSMHRYWIERSQNHYIIEFFDRHAAYYSTLLNLAAPETREVAAMARQHRAILLALIAREQGMAREALASHIRAQKPIVLRFCKRLTGRNEPHSELLTF